MDISPVCYKYNLRAKPKRWVTPLRGPLNSTELRNCSLGGRSHSMIQFWSQSPTSLKRVLKIYYLDDNKIHGAYFGVRQDIIIIIIMITVIIMVIMIIIMMITVILTMGSVEFQGYQTCWAESSVVCQDQSLSPWASASLKTLEQRILWDFLTPTTKRSWFVRAKDFCCVISVHSSAMTLIYILKCESMFHIYDNSCLLDSYDEKSCEIINMNHFLKLIFSWFVQNLYLNFSFVLQIIIN